MVEPFVSPSAKNSPVDIRIDLPSNSGYYGHFFFLAVMDNLILSTMVHVTSLVTSRLSMRHCRLSIRPRI